MGTMTCSHKMRTDNRYLVYSRRYVWMYLVGLTVVLLASILMFTGCEPATRLTVENRMVTDVTVVIQRFDKGGAPSDSETLGTVLAGQTVKLPPLLTLSPDIIGWTVLLKAEDPTGNIIWQKIWPFEEFVKLEEVGWKIVVSPETGS